MRPVVALAAAAILGCGALTAGNAGPVAVATIETAICIAHVATKDAGQPAGVIVSDAIQQCRTDAATVARVLDANRALAFAEARAEQDAGQ